ncbi:hypothetical protein FPV67DRAFT_1452343 [Lyophyllum atratum]|nr:hypothetical protein FPV67DRAFT_1452343 [Lyophyllum atratum]
MPCKKKKTVRRNHPFALCLLNLYHKNRNKQTQRRVRFPNFNVATYNIAVIRFINNEAIESDGAVDNDSAASTLTSSETELELALPVKDALHGARNKRKQPSDGFTPDDNTAWEAEASTSARNSVTIIPQPIVVEGIKKRHVQHPEATPSIDKSLIETEAFQYTVLFRFSLGFVILIMFTETFASKCSMQMQTLRRHQHSPLLAAPAPNAVESYKEDHTILLQDIEENPPLIIPTDKGGVMNERLQDQMLKDQYIGLPFLIAGCEIVSWRTNPRTDVGSWTMFGVWEKQTPNLNVSYVTVLSISYVWKGGGKKLIQGAVLNPF